MATGKPTRLGPWPTGMNNRLPDHAIPNSALRNAVNIDIDNAGKLSRRRGFSKVASAAGAHSGFSCGGGAFYVDGTRLVRLNDDNTTTEICSVAGPVAYEYFDGVLYFSDGETQRKMLANGTLMRWGFDVPPAPVLSSAPGILPAGRYLAAITYQTADGIEHGASAVAEVMLASSGSVVFNFLPVRPDATLRLYLSNANGKTLYHIGNAASTTFTAIAEPGSGVALDKQQISPPPAGSIIRQHDGRMYVAQGKILWYSEPFALSHFRMASGFVQFEDDIAIIEPVSAGMWIATSKKTYLLAPETSEMPGLRDVAGYGAVPGTSLIDEDSKNAMWYSTRGAVIGSNGGELVNLQEKNVAADTGEAGAALLREQDGIKQFIASIKNSSMSPLAASSFIEMEVVRKAG